MRLLLAHGVDDLLRRQPDALVDHLHAGVARAHRDLLGAVGMAVEAGLADQERHAPAELARDAIDLGADVVEAADVVAHGVADAGRRAVFAERLAQRPAPFAGGDAGFGAGDRGRHDVGAAGRGALEVRQAPLRPRLASRAARQAFSRSIWSASASSETVMIASTPPVSGEGSLSRYLLTPTTIWSPRSIASSRAVLESTSCRFM